LFFRYHHFELLQRVAPNFGADARERDLGFQAAAIDEENLADFAIFGENFFALFERHCLLVGSVDGLNMEASRPRRQL
jgi:hypothetical protein